MNPSQRLGLRVAELRHKRGMTQKKLALACGTSYGTIQDVEQGRHGGPRYLTLVALAAALGVTLSKLQEEPGEPTWHPNGKPLVDV